MGKELRVSLTVVGIVLLVFCGLLYQRLTRPEPKLPEAAVKMPPVGEPASPRPSTIGSQPTIVRQPPWSDSDSGWYPEVNNPKQFNPASPPSDDAGILRQPEILPPTVPGGPADNPGVPPLPPP